MRQDLLDYRSRGARALVLLHEKHLRQCVAVWKQAKAAGITLPATAEADYASLEALLQHILHAAGRYMIWMCTQLSLPDPGFRPVPSLTNIETELEDYLEHLLERWRSPLREISDQRLVLSEYESNGGTHHHCIDIMLEHTVLHPIRHEFQLQEWLQGQAKPVLAQNNISSG